MSKLSNLLGKIQLNMIKSVREYNEMGKKYCKRPRLAKLTEQKIIYNQSVEK